MGYIREAAQHRNDGEDLPARWTEELVRDVLRGAFLALLAEPLSARDLPAQIHGVWPATLQNFWDAYQSDEAPKVSRVRATSTQLDEAFRAVPLILMIARERDRKVVTGRLCGVKWRRLAEFDGRSMQHLQQGVWPKALRSIATDLNKVEKNAPQDFTNLIRFASELS